MMKLKITKTLTKLPRKIIRNYFLEIKAKRSKITKRQMTKTKN